MRSASEVLKSFRVDHCDLTQAALGDVLDYSWQTISAMENGREEVPRWLLVLMAVCRSAGLRPQDFQPGSVA